MSEVASRYDRRRARTRGMLIAAGRTLIGANGVGGLKIQDITAEADVGLGSFYNHFSSKEELVEAVVVESLEELVDAEGLAAHPGQDPAVTAGVAVVRIVGTAFRDPDFARLLVRLDHSDLIYDRAMRPAAEEVIRAGIEAGRFDVPDVDVATQNVVAGSLALIRRILDGELDESVLPAQAELTLRLLGLDRVDAAEVAERSVELATEQAVR
jgi:AcrR family transcriptional regulator